MTRRSDAAAVRPIQVPVRPFYALGVLLDAADFESEQSYHRGRIGRALKYLFGSGTVAGLRVVWRPEEEDLVVEPGLALDPLGRLIEIPRPVAVRLRAAEPGAAAGWFERQRAEDLDAGWLLEGAGPAVLVADVFVRFVVCERSRAPSFVQGPFDALDAATPTRLQDGYEVSLVIRTDAVLRRNDPSFEIPLPDDQAILATQPTDTRENALAWARARILAAWRDGTDHWTSDLPERLEEHLPRRSLSGTDPTAVGRDPTSVLLARVTLPVDETVSPPADQGQAPIIDNDVRRFIRHAGIYTRPDLGGGP